MSNDLDVHLAALTSTARAEALAALDEVRARVWREGAIFDVTAGAVGPLVERARDPACLVRPPILQLLAFLYGGEGPTLVGLGRGEDGVVFASTSAAICSYTASASACWAKPL